MFRRIYNFLHIIQNLYLKEKVFIPKKTYSQNGEDIQIIKYFQNKEKAFYVDVGCFHPTRINNTYLLYKKGWRGINIDPSKFSIDLFKFFRPDDINLCQAVSLTSGLKKFYHQKDFSALSSLNQEFAKKQMGDVLKERMLETNTLDEIIEKTKYKKQQIDFLNVDVEGHDMEVLKSLTFEIYSPKLICVEEISENYLLNSTHQFLIKKGYAHLWSGSLSHIYYKLT